MFPVRQRRPMPPQHPFMPPRRIKQNQQNQQNSTLPNLMSIIQDSEGNLDLERMTKTFHQVNQIYNQVSPMISRFWKK